MKTTRVALLETIYKTLGQTSNFWKRDVNELSLSELSRLSDIAKEIGYKKPLQHSRGFGFYMYMQRVAERYGFFTEAELNHRKNTTI